MSKKKEKAPAFIFYPGDVLQQIGMFNNTQKGIYLTLICLQKEQICFSYEELVSIMCGTSDFEKSMIISKMDRLEDGTYIIKWLYDSIDKYNKFSESRSVNRKKSGSDAKDKNTSVDHMLNTSGSYDQHMEIENEYNNSIEDNVGNKNGVAEKTTTGSFKPNEGHIEKIILPEIKANSVIMLVSSTRRQKIELEQVFSLFEVFKIQNFTGDKEYKNEAAIHTHFINWAKTQDFTAAEKKAQKYVIWVVPNTGSESKVTIEEWDRMIKLNPDLKAKRYE